MGKEKHQLHCNILVVSKHLLNIERPEFPLCQGKAAILTTAFAYAKQEYSMWRKIGQSFVIPVTIIMSLKTLE